MTLTKTGDNKIVVAINYAVSAICKENKLWYNAREIAIWAFKEASSDSEMNILANNIYSLLNERNTFKKRRKVAYEESKAILNRLSFKNPHPTDEYNSKMKEVMALDHQIEMNLFQQSKNTNQIIKKWIDDNSLKEMQDRIQNLDVPTVFKDSLLKIITLQSSQDKAELKLKEILERSPIDVKESEGMIIVNFLDKEKAMELLRTQAIINSKTKSIAMHEGMLRKTFGKNSDALLNKQNSTK